MELKNKIPTNRNFGLVFCFVFFLIFLEPIIRDAQLRYWSLVISLIFMILGLINSKLLTLLNKIWYKFGLFLGKIVSPLVMGLIFFLVVTPIGIFMRLLGKDLIGLKKHKKDTYWIAKDIQKSSMKNQF